MTIEQAMWIIVAISVYGTVMNSRRNALCFPIWIATNLVWIAYNIYKDAPAQAGLFTIYTGLAVYGWIYWTRAGKPTTKSLGESKQNQVDNSDS